AYHVFYRMNSNSRKADKEQLSRVYEDNIRNADMVLAGIDASERDLHTIAVRFGIFQRLDYMLHVPIRQMNRENDFYMQVVRRLRRDWWKGIRNPYLTMKNKLYLTLFVIAPRGIRKLHRKIKKLS
ncbi:MAG: glycosyltransferase family 2 protein, partial [Lachnospiraceae bacterium]|nr:glycosyltransferase family 2 protein [Lachnospiraceae bacterium]